MSKNKIYGKNPLSINYLFKNWIIFILICPILSSYGIDIQTKEGNNTYPIINCKYIGEPSLIYKNKEIMNNNAYYYENGYLYIIINDNNSVNITLVWDKIKNIDNEIILLYNPEQEENNIETDEMDEMDFNENKIILEFSNNINMLNIGENADLVESNEKTNFIDDKIFIENININKSILLNGNEMFKNCSNLNLINFKNFNTTLIANAAHMFDSCTELIYIYDYNIECAEDISYLFYNCNNLKNIISSNFNLNDVKNMEFMFYNCYKLTSIKISISTYNVVNMRSIFWNCTSLRKIEFSNKFETYWIVI